MIEGDKISEFARDFKRYSSRKIKENILRREPQIIDLFIGENGEYEFWQETNMPENEEQLLGLDYWE